MPLLQQGTHATLRCTQLTRLACAPQPTDSEESQDEEVAAVAATSVASVAETLEADNIVPLTPKREREGAAPVASTRSMVRAALGPPARFDSREHASLQ